MAVTEYVVRIRIRGEGTPDEQYLEMDLLGALEDIDYPVEDVTVIEIAEDVE